MKGCAAHPPEGSPGWPRPDARRHTMCPSRPSGWRLGRRTPAWRRGGSPLEHPDVTIKDAFAIQQRAWVAMKMAVGRGARRRPKVGLALGVCGGSPTSPSRRTGAQGRDTFFRGRQQGRPRPAGQRSARAEVGLAFRASESACPGPHRSTLEKVVHAAVAGTSRPRSPIIGALRSSGATPAQGLPTSCSTPSRTTPPRRGRAGGKQSPAGGGHVVGQREAGVEERGDRGHWVAAAVV
jgi:hypothetical protein